MDESWWEDREGHGGDVKRIDWLDERKTRVEESERERKRKRVSVADFISCSRRWQGAEGTDVPSREC